MYFHSNQSLSQNFRELTALAPTNPLEELFTHPLPELFSQRRQYLEKIADHSIFSHIEDWGIPVFIDCHNYLSCAHARLVLDCSGDPGSDV
jgi:hypothetical protein